MLRKYARFMGTISILVLLFVACSSNSNHSEGTNGKEPSNAGGTKTPVVPVEPEKPVTLKFYSFGWFSEDDYNLLFVNPVKAKYPHITIEDMASRGDLYELIASGEIPDLTVNHNGNLLWHTDIGIMSNLNDLVKQHQIDLNQFDPFIIDSFKIETGELMALPYAVNFTALYYNEEIFDKFATDYPPDGMSWDESIELANKVTREDGGIQYRGIHPETVSRLSRVMGIDNVDSRTNKAAVNNDQWRAVFEVYKKVFVNQQNRPEDILARPNDEFFTKQILAMYPTVNIFGTLARADEMGLKWDVAQYPSMPGRPGIGTDVDGHALGIPVSAKNKEAAMKVMEVVTSDEVQMSMVRKTARKSPLKDPVFNEVFAADLNYTKGKRISSIFKSRIVEAPRRSVFLSDANKIVNKYVRQYVDNLVDLNTALRLAEEEINQVISEKRQ